MSLIRRVPWTVQPQTPARVEQRWSAPLRFALLPPQGFQDMVRGGPTAQTSVPGVFFSTSGKLLDPAASSYAEFPGLSIANGLTLIGVWRSNASQYSGGEGSKYLLSTRTAGNAGWSWGKNSAVGGGATGNVTRQEFVLQGIAQYFGGAYDVESFVDTAVAVRYDKAAGTVAFYRFGRQTSSSAASTSGAAGGGLVVGAQGPYTGVLSAWPHRAGPLLVFEGALSDAEILSLSETALAPYRAFEPRRIIIPVSAGAGGGAAAGLASETDAALAPVGVGIRAVGLATEADTALALAGVQRKVAGTASETDTALALAGVQRKAAGLAAEADTALARAGVQIKLAGRADEADSALALLVGGGSSVGLAAETDAAFALVGRQIKPAGFAAETDTSLTLAGRLIRAAGLAAEADVAFALAGRQIKAVGRANEVDTALSLLTGAGGSVGMASEIDTAFALAAVLAGGTVQAPAGPGYTRHGQAVRRPEQASVQRPVGRNTKRH